MDFSSQIILLMGLLLLISVLSSTISTRLGAPVLLVFLLLGMLAGVDGPGGIRFADYQGTFIVGSIALAVILFDGGLSTPRQVFRVGLRPALSLSTIGVFITAGIIGVVATVVLGLSWLEGLLLGAIISSTDAAAVFSILSTRGSAIKERVGATLEIESGTNDPMAVFLTIALVELIQSGKPGFDLEFIGFFIQQMGLGALLGVSGGYAMVLLLDRLVLTTYGLYPLLALGGGILTFGVTNSLEGSGFLAVYLAGLILGNHPLHMRQEIKKFHEGMAWLAQIIMFIMLGLLSSPVKLLEIAPQGLLIAVVIMFIARPLAVLISLAPFHFPWREQVFISWVGLRGAVPIILAIFPLLANLPNAYLIFNVTFFVVLISLLVQGWSIGSLSRKLGLEVPEIAGPLQQFDLGVPGKTVHEMLSYHVEDNSHATHYGPLDLPVPQDTKPVIVLRGSALLRLRQVQQLQAGDIIYLMAPSADVEKLNKLFAKQALGVDAKQQRYFGEFVLSGAAILADLAAVYDVDIPEAKQGLTLAHYIVSELHTRPVVGDQVKLKGLTLIVKEIEAGVIVRVGLMLQPE